VRCQRFLECSLKAKRIIITLSFGVAVGTLGAWLFYTKALSDTKADSLRRECISNLGFIWSAKRVAAEEQRLAPGSLVSTQTLVPYLIGGWRDCPGGGIYTINPVGKDPTCSLPGHSLHINLQDSKAN
jgi:hypothetical protein